MSKTRNIPTHVDTLAWDAPKSRRRIRRLGAHDSSEAQTIARANERREASAVAAKRKGKFSP